jgi:hypothetical protein
VLAAGVTPYITVGIGDVRAAEMMVEKHRESVEGLYMHQVQPLERTYGYKGPESIQYWKDIGICFFTYVNYSARIISLHRTVF